MKQTSKEDKDILLQRIQYLQDQSDKFLETTLIEEK
jgi:hypothetical protein